MTTELINSEKSFVKWLLKTFANVRKQKSRIKPQIKARIAKYVGLFCHYCNCNLKLISHKQNHVFLEFQKKKAFQTLYRGI